MNANIIIEDRPMIMLHQTVKDGKQPPDKVSGETKQPPAKAEGSQTKGKEAAEKTEKTVQETAPRQDTAPAAQPVIPFQAPPGAQIAVPSKEPPRKFEIGSILFPALWLIGILIIGALMLSWLRKYRERQMGAITLSANDQLTTFRHSLEQGDMTDEEFKKVKTLLAEKLRKTAKPVATAPTPEAPAMEEGNTNSPKS